LHFITEHFIALDGNTVSNSICFEDFSVSTVTVSSADDIA